MNIDTLLKAYFGDNKAALAKAAGVSRQAVSQWDLDETVKAEYVLPICASLEWRVTPHMLRPDLYPNPSDAMPALIPLPSLADRRKHDQRVGDRRASDFDDAPTSEATV